MTPTKPPSYQFLDDNLDTSPIALRLLTTPTSPQQTPPQKTNPQTTPQSTPPTPLSTPSPQTTPTPQTTPPPPPPTPPPTSQHPMVTRSKVGIVKANPKYNLHVTTSSFIPKSPFHSPSEYPNWQQSYGQDTTYLLLYVDAIIITAFSTSLLQRIISLLHAEFPMTDLGPLNYFLGEQKLGPEGSPDTDPTLYSSLAGSLQYLTFTRPDLSYAVQQLCLYMHDPREPHINAMKRVLRYLRGTTDLGLQLLRSTTSQLIA
ncbi:ribonuclease H-like domain-containing protein [Tanacetum coccineum]